MRLRLLTVNVVLSLCGTLLIFECKRPADRANRVLTESKNYSASATVVRGHALQDGRLNRAMPGTSRSLSAFADLPLAFESNVGQADRSIGFISSGPGYTLLTNPDTAIISTCATRNRTHRGSGATICSSHAIGMRFLGANQHAVAVGEKKLPGKSNYFLGSDSSHWLVDVPHFAQVRYVNTYPGIDLVYYGNQQKLEYDLVIRPHADPAMIAFTVDGGAREPVFRIGETGELLMQTASGTIHLQAPVAYQLGSGKRQLISVRYSRRSRNRIGFELGSYDKSRELIIDPVLSYSSFLGGSSDDFAYATAVDSAGNIYVAGGTTSADFPLGSAPLQGTYGGADSNTQGVTGDVFVSKFDPTGKTLVYSTYVGGTADENAYGIAVDSTGNAYLTGATNSADFPVTTGALQTSFGGGPNDVFIFKLNPTGSALVYSTYLGTSLGGERGFGIAVDATGDAYVTGDAAPDFPVTTGSFHGGVNDAELTELNPTGTGKVFSIFFGGNGTDEGYGIAVDTAGNISITGATTSTDLPVTANAAQAHLAGTITQDAFVAQFDKTGTLTYCSYLGGSANELGSSLGAIAVDYSGRIYVTGSTASADFPVTSGAFQTAYGGGGSDVFVTAIDPSKSSSLVYSTLLGGGGDDDSGEFARGIAVDAAGNAVITGSTNSANFPTLQPTQSSLAGGTDAFVAKLNASGSALIYSTYMGGTGDDFGAAVAVDQVGNTYVTGRTTSSDLPTSSALQGTLNGPSDAFIANLSADFGISSSPATASVTAGNSAMYTVSVSVPDGLYGLPVSLACSGAPSFSTCTISPQQVTPGSSGATATVTIATTAPQFSNVPGLRKVTSVYALFVPLLMFSTGFLKRGCSAKRRIVGGLFAMVLVSNVVVMMGCSSSNTHTPTGGTPTGTSTITITGTASSTSHTTTVTLNVT